MLTLYFVASALAQDPQGGGDGVVEPNYGDFPTPEEYARRLRPRSELVVLPRMDWSRFGRLPVRRSFRSELDASIREVAPQLLALDEP